MSTGLPTAMIETSLPLPLVRRGKVRDVYAVDDDRLLLVTTDRISAFDVVMNEAIPYKGAVLTQLTAWWLSQLSGVVEHHLLSADTVEIVRRVLVVRGAAYPPPSPEQYAANAGEQVRLVDWRSQVVALARRDRPVDLVIARQRAEAILRVVLKLEPGQLRFLRALEAGTLDATPLGDRAFVSRVHANPGLLWRLQRGTEGLEER